MTRRLPPFGPLIAFDAVVRHRSFTRAALKLYPSRAPTGGPIRLYSFVNDFSPAPVKHL